MGEDTERRLRITRAAFDDADEFAHSLRDWDFEFVASEGAPFRLDHEEADIGVVRLVRQQHGPALFLTGSAPPTEIGIAVPDPGSAPFVWAGDVIRPGTLPVGPPGGTCEGVQPAGAARSGRSASRS